MRIDQKGFDPFWGADPFVSKERPKIDWEKPQKGAGTAEDNRAFFEGRKKDPADESTKKRVDFKA